MNPKLHRADSHEIILLIIVAAALGLMLAPEEVSLPSSDPTAYYAYLRSSLIDGDLDFRNDYQRHRLQQPEPPTTGLYHNPQPVGPALLWAPFFLLAHAVTGIVNAISRFEVYARDGHEVIYLKAVTWGSGVFVWGGLLACYLWARRLFSQRNVQWSMLVLGFTPLVIVCLYRMPIMSHPASFLLASLVFLLWFGVRQEPRPDRFLLLGILIGLACIVRYQNGALLLFPVSTLATILWRPGPRPKRLRRIVLLCGAGLLLGFLAGVAPQLVVWKVLRKHWLAMPYDEQMRGTYFHFLNPEIGLALFSHPRYFNSLLPWVPAVFLVLCGFVWLWKRDRELTILALSFLLVQLYTTAITRQMVRLEGRANHLLIRRFDSCLPLLILGLAALSQRAGQVFGSGRSRVRWTLAVGLAVVLCLDGWIMSHVPTIWHLRRVDSVNSWALHYRNFVLLIHDPARALSGQGVAGNLHRLAWMLPVLLVWSGLALRRRRLRSARRLALKAPAEKPPAARPALRQWAAWLSDHRDWVISTGLTVYLLLWAGYLWKIGPVTPPPPG